MEQALQSMLAQMQSLQAQLAEANNNATKVASVEPKAEEKPRKKWYEMTDAEKAEARKEAAEKAKATPIEERKAAIEKKLEAWEAENEVKYLERIHPETGVAWVAHHVITSKTGVKYDYLSVHPVSWADNYEEVKTWLSEHGFRGSCYKGLLRYSKVYTDADLKALQDKFYPEEEPVAETSPVAEPEEVEEVEEVTPVEEVEELPEPETHVEVKGNPLTDLMKSAGFDPVKALDNLIKENANVY